MGNASKTTMQNVIRVWVDIMKGFVRDLIRAHIQTQVPFHHPEIATIEGIVTHEYGHFMYDRVTQIDPNFSQWFENLCQQHPQEVYALGSYTRQEPDPCIVGRHPYNREELFAEAFAATYQGSTLRTSPFFHALEQKLAQYSNL